MQPAFLTLTNKPLMTVSFLLMTAPVGVPDAADPPCGLCFMLCHCFSPEFKYDCTRLRVLASWTRLMLIMTPALIAGIHAAGI